MELPVHLLGIPSGISSLVPWLSYQKALQMSVPGGLRGHSSLGRAAALGAPDRKAKRGQPLGEECSSSPPKGTAHNVSLTQEFLEGSN